MNTQRRVALKKAGLLELDLPCAPAYPNEFQRAGIVLVTPKESEREFIHRAYIDELLKNQFLPQTRTEILRIAQRMKDEDGVEAVVLAGTELPLLLRGSGAPIEFLDTTVIHVEAIVERLTA